MSIQYLMTSNNGFERVVSNFPWESSKLPCPWDDSKYARVVIPLTEREKRNSKARVHIQIVSRKRLEVIKNRLG